MKGLAKGVDPLAAVNEIDRIKEEYGEVTPEVIVRESENPESILHPIFEWDNEKAGYNYRLQQARGLINNIAVTVISDGEPKEVDVFEVVSVKGGYKSFDAFTPEDIDYVKKSAIGQLNYWKNKLSVYREFEKAVKHIALAVESIV